jgi:hypothetical protein
MYTISCVKCLGTMHQWETLRGLTLSTKAACDVIEENSLLLDLHGWDRKLRWPVFNIDFEKFVEKYTI